MELFHNFRKFSKIITTTITVYSEPLKFFRWLRKQFADKSENNLPSQSRHLPEVAIFFFFFFFIFFFFYLFFFLFFFLFYFYFYFYFNNFIGAINYFKIISTISTSQKGRCERGYIEVPCEAPPFSNK
jgi:hypothetical protein